MAGPELEIVGKGFVARIERKSVRAIVSIDPSTLAARSSKSGRPTSPTKMKSPVTMPIGRSFTVRSVTRKHKCSGVWPGVSRTAM